MRLPQPKACQSNDASDCRACHDLSSCVVSEADTGPAYGEGAVEHGRGENESDEGRKVTAVAVSAEQAGQKARVRLDVPDAEREVHAKEGDGR